MIGRTISHYQVTSKLGAGGMGEVYRARDTKLNREVAIKILPAAFARDAERLARFSREAQVLASLNHPNIAAIYGIEELNGTRALVMELVEGPTLAERIAAGPLPVAEALGIAKQIAEALEIAHERGIIHRDLKPANVKATPEGAVKVLDFGLAKVFVSETPRADLSHSPTMIKCTESGIILGTPAYMSPEQARGMPVDKRTDVWAFGCVLYEMLAGTYAFPGDTVTDMLAGVLAREPDWTQLPAATPAPVRALLQRCLRKEPRQRLHDIADARLALEDTLAAMSGAGASANGASGTIAAPAPRAAWRHPLPIALALLSLVLAAALVWAVGNNPSAPPREPTHVSINLPADQELTAWGHAVSPDGRDIVFVGLAEEGPPGPEGNVPRLYHRRLGESASRALPGTEGARAPFFSPDGEWVAFTSMTDIKLKKIALQGGGPALLADLVGVSNGGIGTWTPANQILYGDRQGPVRRVPAEGGAPEIVVPRTALETGEQGMVSPVAFPNGSGIMFTTVVDAGTVAAYVNGLRKTLLKEAYQPRFSATGHLLFWRRAGASQVDLEVVGFDQTRAELTGAPVSVFSVAGTSRFDYDLSPAGTLVYRAGEPEYRGGRFVWVTLGAQPPPPRLTDPPTAVNFVICPRVSPDGRFVLYHQAAGPQDNRLVIRDLATSSTRILASGRHFWATWNHDGSRVIYQETPDAPGGAGLMWKPADGGTPAERLTSSKSWQQPQVVTPDGRFLIYQEAGGLGTRDTSLEDNYDLWLLPLAPLGEPRPLLRTKVNEKLPHVSADQRWMAYVSDETGREEIWVRPFPEGAAIQVSHTGGTEPVWAPDGRTLYYRDVAGTRLFAVPVTAGSVPQFGTPTVKSGLWVPAFPFGRMYDITPDGRALLLQSEPTYGRELQVILNFDEEIRRKMAGVK